MKYLLDSDILIDNLRKKAKLDEKVVKSGCINIINLGELVYGAFKSKYPIKALELVENYIKDLGVEVISLEKEIIYVFGKIKADLEKEGFKLEDFDLLIASTAIVYKLTLVTRNVKHFKRIKGLKLYSSLEN
ncbi:hypothetical protein A2164_02375 [Candidatus Curtissbacteria bacterium RBG_13_35_7]|uniref:PIN domain-containing protein n=1 Tax=Candidatus Curtissbacteria bacterium RBG_13_35_7 TaxID=1797705 RepID=A0A1F5G494_9BACT|nr:MAG: hypothetical protein A2164_02375 [Candidatus Curtissbacteria bacterium RBG_13_35_7]